MEARQPSMHLLLKRRARVWRRVACDEVVERRRPEPAPHLMRAEPLHAGLNAGTGGRGAGGTPQPLGDGGHARPHRVELVRYCSPGDRGSWFFFSFFF